MSFDPTNVPPPNDGWSWAWWWEAKRVVPQCHPHRDRPFPARRRVWTLIAVIAVVVVAIGAAARLLR